MSSFKNKATQENIRVRLLVESSRLDPTHIITYAMKGGNLI